MAAKYSLRYVVSDYMDKRKQTSAVLAGIAKVPEHAITSLLRRGDTPQKRHRESLWQVICGDQEFWGCLRKPRYKRQEDAEMAIRAVVCREGLQPYHCSYCDGWHKGHPQRGKHSA